MADPLRDRVGHALRRVIDPETGRDLVAMGMIYELHVEAGAVDIAMTTTTPGCPLSEMLRGGVEAAVAAVPGVERVAVRLTWDPPWTPDRMAPLGV